jgi:hypothetical protein
MYGRQIGTQCAVLHAREDQLSSVLGCVLASLWGTMLTAALCVCMCAQLSLTSRAGSADVGVVIGIRPWRTSLAGGGAGQAPGVLAGRALGEAAHGLALARDVSRGATGTGVCASHQVGACMGGPTRCMAAWQGRIGSGGQQAGMHTDGRTDGLDDVG